MIFIDFEWLEFETKEINTLSGRYEYLAPDIWWSKKHLILLELVKIAYKNEALKKQDPFWHLAARVVLDRINKKSL